MAPVYSNPVIPVDSLVVVTGSNGYIGSHIVDEVLSAGYRVRGTVRDLNKSAWMQEYFDKKYGQGRFERVIVTDIGAAGAFDEASKGASGFVHSASDLSFDKDPNKVVTPMIAGMKHALASAAKEPKIKRFVYTSSSTAALSAKPNEVITVHKDTWNDETVKASWKEPFDEEGHEWLTYGASKTEAERAAWEFVKEKKPGFTFNAVLPNANFGTVLHSSHHYNSTASWITGFWKGGSDHVKGIPVQWFVDVVDTARIHVAALLNPEVKEERLFAFGETFTFSQILGILRKAYPDRKFAANLPNEGNDLSKIPNDRAEQLLKDFSRNGWTTLEESVLGHAKQLERDGI